MMEWFRWYHGTATDPKFAIVAKRSGQPRHVVLACWAMILEHASSREDRGTIGALDLEEVAVTLDLDVEQVESVFSAMEAKGLIENNCLKNWDKRQPKREDSTAADRKERWKEKKRTGTHANETERTGTQENALERTGTHANETERMERARLEKRREEYKNPPTPHGGGGDEKTPNTKTPSGDYAPDFEAAWKVYPRKDGKRKAFAAWQKAKKRGMPVADMPAHIDARAYEPDWLKDDGRFVPHMASWLNADGWLDEGAALPTPRPPDDEDDFWAVDFWGNPLTPKAEPEVRS